MIKKSPWSQVQNGTIRNVGVLYPEMVKFSYIYKKSLGGGWHFAMDQTIARIKNPLV